MLAEYEISSSLADGNKMALRAWSNALTLASSPSSGTQSLCVATTSSGMQGGCQLLYEFPAWSNGMVSQAGMPHPSS